MMVLTICTFSAGGRFASTGPKISGNIANDDKGALIIRAPSLTIGFDVIFTLEVPQTRERETWQE